MSGALWLDEVHRTAPVNLAVAANAVTVTQEQHTVNMAGAVQEVNTLTKAAPVQGDVVTLRPDTAFALTLRQGAAGNIRTPHNQAVRLAAVTDYATFKWNGANWVLIDMSVGVTPAPLTFVIAAGVIGTAATQFPDFLLVDTEAAAADDDLDTIFAANSARGAKLRIMSVSNDRDVILTNAGNIRTPFGQNLVLGLLTDYADLEFDGTNWNVVGFRAVALVTSTLTIAAGAVTASRSLHQVDTEAAAASDDLDTINGGQIGAVLALRIVNAARVVVLTQAGNIRLAGARVRPILGTSDVVILRFDGTNWVEVAFVTQTESPVKRKSSQGPSAGVAGNGAFALSQAFAAGTLQVADTIRIRALARASVQPGATNTTYDLRFAGIVVATSTAADLGADGYCLLEADVRVLTTGAGGTFTSMGRAYQRATGAGAPTVTVQNTIGSAVNTTVSQSVTSNVTQDAADTSILEILEVDFL